MKEETGYQGRDDWFQTWGGETLHILEPDINRICIEDIAHALARQCRYNGHVNCAHYSVAQHSVLVSRILPAEFALEGLLHDAAEAYLGDCIRPLKNQLPEYQGLEAKWESVIAEKFELEYNKCLGVVKNADLFLLATELRDLWEPGSRHSAWNYKKESNTLLLGISIYPWPVKVAEDIFLSSFNDLKR